MAPTTELSSQPRFFAFGEEVGPYIPTLFELVDIPAIQADLADDGVSAPEPFVEGLRSVVADARASGLEFSVVVTEYDGSVYTQARDLAKLLESGHSGVVLVRTPTAVGSYSETVPRARLEAAQDHVHTTFDPVEGTAMFAGHLQRPPTNWGLVSAGLLLTIVLVVAVVSWYLRRV